MIKANAPQATGTKPDTLRATALESGTSAIVSAVKLLKSLGDEGVEVLRGIHAQLSADLASVRGEESLPTAVAAQPSAIELRRQDFVTKYNIKVLGEGQVSFTLPNGASRIDILNEAQALSPELHGRPAVYAERLAKWTVDSAYTEKVTADTAKSVDGNVSNSIRMNRAEQEAKGWNNIDLADLAAAHAAYFIATGKDLFGGNVVRACGGALYFYADGLNVHGCNDAHRDSYVAASAALPSRN
jgi:hypothetical protein